MLALLRKWLHPPTLLAAFLSTLLTLAPYPVLAQTSVPVLPDGQVASAIHEANQAAADLGATNATLIAVIVGVVVFLIIEQVLIAVVVWKFGLPLVNSNVKANERADSSQQAMLNQSDKITGSVERTANILTNLETRAEAEQRSKDVQANSDKNTAAINSHIDEAVVPVNANLTTIHEKLAELTEQVGQAAKREEMAVMTESMTAMSGKMTVITQMLQELMTDVRAMTDAQDTPKAPPVAEP